MSTSMETSAWYKWAFVVVLIFLILTSYVVRWRLDPVSPVAAGSAASHFSAVQARSVLSAILGDQRPHPVDSLANDGVRARIVSTLSNLGYRPEIQDATSCRDAFLQSCARVRNIIVTRPGTKVGKSILLSAHYDSVGAGPGANDDGSGVAALLEIARLLKQRPVDKNGVILLFTEGEEAGLLGAQAFALQSRWVKNVAAAINVEARGTSGQSALFETGDNSGWLIDAYASSSRHPLTNSLLNALYKLMPNDTDLSVFKGVGIQGLNFAYGEHFAYYHTANDNLKSLSLGSLQQQGDNVYDLLQALLSADLPAGNVTGSWVYTDVLGLGVVRWPATLGVYIVVVLLLAFAFAMRQLGRRFHFPARSIVRGFLCAPLSIGVGGAAAYLLMTVLSLVNGKVSSWHSDGLFNRVLLWSAVLLAVISAQRLVVRKANPLGIWIGVGCAWLLLSILTAILLPGISYLFILPSLALVVASWLVLLMGRDSDGRVSVLFVFPALVSFIVTFPVIFMVEIMLGFNQIFGTIGMGIFLGLAANFVAPLMVAGSASPAHRTTRYGVLAVALGSAVLSIQASAYTEAQPEHLNVMYRQGPDHSAYLFADTAFRPPAAVLARMGSGASLRPMYPWSHSAVYAVPVKSAELPSARLTVLSAGRSISGREITARIDTDATAESILILVPKSMGLVSIRTDGQLMDYSGTRSQLGDYKAFICYGESCNGRKLIFDMKDDSPQSVLVVKFAAVPEMARPLMQARSVYAIAQNDGDQSLVISRSDL